MKGKGRKEDWAKGEAELHEDLCNFSADTVESSRASFAF